MPKPMCKSHFKKIPITHLEKPSLLLKNFRISNVKKPALLSLNLKKE
jgi:hypothetical protein